MARLLKAASGGRVEMLKGALEDCQRGIRGGELRECVIFPGAHSQLSTSTGVTLQGLDAVGVSSPVLVPDVSGCLREVGVGFRADEIKGDLFYDFSEDVRQVLIVEEDWNDFDESYMRVMVQELPECDRED